MCCLLLIQSEKIETVDGISHKTTEMGLEAIEYLRVLLDFNSEYREREEQATAAGLSIRRPRSRAGTQAWCAFALVELWIVRTSRG
jgi:hypothetical protein